MTWHTGLVVLRAAIFVVCVIGLVRIAQQMIEADADYHTDILTLMFLLTVVTGLSAYEVERGRRKRWLKITPADIERTIREPRES